MDIRLTAVYEKDGDWWIASIQEIPGAFTQGATIDEARENLVEAVELLLEANRELADQQILGKSVIKENLLVNS